MDEKIIPFEKISTLIEELRRTKPSFTAVLCHGCFDIVHPGHIRHLRFAKEQGTCLVVSITPDSCIQKGSGRPFMPQGMRAENLAALECVDYVTIAPGDTGLEPIAAVKPDIYVKGSEYAESADPRFLKEKELAENLGGQMVYSSGEVVFSSSRIIMDCNLETAIEEKLKYICAKQNITSELFHKVLEGAKRKRVIVVGEALIEEKILCDKLGISQNAPVLSVAQRHKTSAVSGAGMIAMHLASAGAKVSFLTSVREEGFKFEFLKNAMTGAGIECLNVKDRFRTVCVKSSYFVERNQVLEVEDAPFRATDSKLMSTMVEGFTRLLSDDVSCVLVSDSGYGLLSEPIVQNILRIARKKKILTIGNMSATLRTNLKKFSSSKILCTTEANLRSYMHAYENGLSVLVHEFYSKYDIPELYLQLSDSSSLYFRPSKYTNMESFHIPPLLLKREGNTGCQEAFIAGITLGRVSGMTETQAIYLGSIFSATYLNGRDEVLNMERVVQLINDRKELNQAPADQKNASH